jgi:LacI family transcriptional regulator
MKVTLREVARRAGVSPITVSRAFSGTHPVSQETRARVAAIADELGYAPDLLARSLVQKQSPIIGVVIPELANPFFISIVDVIQTEAHKRGLMVVIAQSERQEDLEHKCINQFDQIRVAGAVVTPMSTRLDHLLRLQAHGTKVVVVARQWQDGSYVTVDDFKGGYMAGAI